MQIKRSVRWGMLLIVVLLSVQQATTYFPKSFSVLISWPLLWIALGLSMLWVIWPRGLYFIGCLPRWLFILSKHLLRVFISVFLFYCLFTPVVWVLRFLYPDRIYFQKKQNKQRATYWEPYDSSLVKRRDWRVI